MPKPVRSTSDVVAGERVDSISHLVGAGLAPAGGVAFYVADGWLPWCHETRHLFVLGGSPSHFVAIAPL